MHPQISYHSPFLQPPFPILPASRRLYVIEASLFGWAKPALRSKGSFRIR
jgi:hypothetical protein